MLASLKKHVSWNRYFPDALRIVAVLVEEQEDYPPHDHKFVEVVVVCGGDCWQETALGKKRITHGDVSVFRPGAWHSYTQCRKLRLYNCCFDPGILGRELGWMIDDPWLGRLLWSIPLSAAQFGTAFLQLHKSEMDQCQRILNELCALSTEEKSSYRSYQLGLLILLISTLARQLPIEPEALKPGKPNPAVIAALKLIDDHPEHPWSLEDLAARVHVLPEYLVRSFRNVAGLPPMAYLRRRRLELATTLLIRSDQPVGEVGNLVGWPDANYFTRRFHAEFGLTPSAYRARFAKISGAFETGNSKPRHPA
jgi:AraC family transcriptional regulator, L-rhamnose operon transcriptional activator RhaR